MGRELLGPAIEKLRGQYFDLTWVYHDFSAGSINEKMYRWPGPPDEDILVLVHQSSGVQELFHRHDFFYFNYTYQGEYDSLSYKYDIRSQSARVNYMQANPLQDMRFVCMITRIPQLLVC